MVSYSKRKYDFSYPIMMLWWYMVVYVLLYTKDGEDIILLHLYVDACGYFDDV